MIDVSFTWLSRNVHYDTKHLYIIISIIDKQRALFVNVTSKEENKDCTCTLVKGDHPFITHDSVINYGDAQDSLIYNIEQAIETKLFTPHDPVSQALLKKIREGALISPAFPQKYLKHIPTK
jgi:hypothetical protein